MNLIYAVMKNEESVNSTGSVKAASHMWGRNLRALWSTGVCRVPQPSACPPLFFFKIYLFLDRGREGEREGEKCQCVWLPLTCRLPGTWPAAQACALTGNGISNPLVHRPALNPLNHASQGPSAPLTAPQERTLAGESGSVSRSKIW